MQQMPLIEVDGVDSEGFLLPWY